MIRCTATETALSDLYNLTATMSLEVYKSAVNRTVIESQATGWATERIFLVAKAGGSVSVIRSFGRSQTRTEAVVLSISAMPLAGFATLVTHESERRDPFSSSILNDLAKVNLIDTPLSHPLLGESGRKRWFHGRRISQRTS